MEEKKNDFEKSKSTTNNNTILSYIKINHKSNLEELDSENQSLVLMELVNSLSVDREEVGEGINKFFDTILPENKEGEKFLINIALANTINNSKKIDTNLYEQYMDEIINLKITKTFTLTIDYAAKIAYILSVIYFKLKKNKKINDYNDLIKQMKKYKINYFALLNQYSIKNQNSDINNLNYVESDGFMDLNKSTRVSRLIDNGFFADSNTDYNNDNLQRNNIAFNSFRSTTFVNDKIVKYKFKELKEYKKMLVPIEMFILIGVFEKVKKLKLVISSFNNNITNVKNTMTLNEIILEQKDIKNNIFFLFNLDWLFPYLIEIEVDLTNENILRDQIMLQNREAEFFAKKVKKSLKQTNYQSGIYKKRIYDIYQKSIFNINKNSSVNEEEESSNEMCTVSFISPNKDKEEESDNLRNQKKIEFLKKYTITFEMIIVYWYFITQMNTLKTCYFTIPIGMEQEIINMLQLQKIYLFDFNFLSFSDKIKLLDATIDFNSLDSKFFEKVLSFIFKNQSLQRCRISFFPPEDYFEPEILLHLIKNNDENFAHQSKYDIKQNEEIDVYFLRKLSDYFENNIKRFFHLLTIKNTLTEIALIFDSPLILNKIDNFSLVIIKFIMNLFIFIDNSTNKHNGIKLKSLTLIADKLILDNRKNYFFYDFFDKLTIYQNEKLCITKLTFQANFYSIKNIYTIIPYNIQYLSLGSFDLETLDNFVEYITSSKFCIHSNINTLQLNLSSVIISLDECFHILVKLFKDYPKNLKVLNLYTFLYAEYNQIIKLFSVTDYNTIENISMKLIDIRDKKTKKNKNNIIDNLIKLHFVKRNLKNINLILKLAYGLSKKINNRFMDYNIYCGIEKFMVSNENKHVIIQCNK